MGYADEVLADSPYAYYRLNDTSGNPIDSSGNSRNATAVAGTPIYSASGGPVSDGGYLSFDGTDDYVALGNMTSWNEAQATFAVEFWMRTSTSSNAAIMGTLNDGVSVAYHVKLNRNAADSATDAGDLSTYVRETAAGSAERVSTVTSDGDYTDGTWQHIGIDYSFSVPGFETITIYRNGLLEASAISKAGSIESSQLGFFQYALILGARNLRGSTIEYADIDLAEVAFYRGNLGSTRWAAHYQAGTAVPLLSQGWGIRTPLVPV